MKAVVYHGIGDIRIDDVPEPHIMGNCNHRKYIPMLVDMVQNGTLDPAKILTQYESLDSAVDAYKQFAEHQPGWIKVELASAS